MAKYDQGGGCACGLQEVCDCESNLQSDGSSPRVTDTPRTLRSRLESASVASCNCMTKTPIHTAHDEICRYRILVEFSVLLDDVEFLLGQLQRIESAQDVSKIENLRKKYFL